MLLLTPFLDEGLAESRTELQVYWELLGQKNQHTSYFSSLKLVSMFGLWFKKSNCKYNDLYVVSLMPLVH